MSSLGQSIFKLGFQISPIILSGGVANLIPGGKMPIVLLTEPINFVNGLLSGGADFTLDGFFAHFEPLPGSTLVDNNIGAYPFANQATAANAIIANPLRISLLMKCPAQKPGGYVTKLLTMTALKEVLSQHNALGGTYIVITPAQIYVNCILVGLRDVGGPGQQVQTHYQWDFVKPLISLQQAQQAQNSLMSRLSSGARIDDPTWSGPAPAVGNASSVVSPSVVPASQPLIGGGIAPPPAVQVSPL